MTPSPKTVRICHLYPRLLSVAGDRGNLLALAQRCTWRGIRYSVTEADVGEVPDFTQSDLILVHGGQDREMTAAARDLAAKAGPLRDAIESDAVVLAVCAGYQLLGRYYAPHEGEPIPGLSVLDVATEGGPVRFIGHVAAACDLGSGEQHQLTGFENHSGRTYLGRGARPLGRVLAGAGNNGEDGTEGADRGVETEDGLAVDAGIQRREVRAGVIVGLEKLVRRMVALITDFDCRIVS